MHTPIPVPWESHFCKKYHIRYLFSQQVKLVSLVSLQTWDVTKLSLIVFLQQRHICDDLCMQWGPTRFRRCIFRFHRWCSRGRSDRVTGIFPALFLEWGPLVEELYWEFFGWHRLMGRTQSRRLDKDSLSLVWRYTWLQSMLEEAWAAGQPIVDTVNRSRPRYGVRKAAFQQFSAWWLAGRDSAAGNGSPCLVM